MKRLFLSIIIIDVKKCCVIHLYLNVTHSPLINVFHATRTEGCAVCLPFPLLVLHRNIITHNVVYVYSLYVCVIRKSLAK